MTQSLKECTTTTICYLNYFSLLQRLEEIMKQKHFYKKDFDLGPEKLYQNSIYVPALRCKFPARAGNFPLQSGSPSPTHL
jgi:hypothetical protein